MKVIIAGSRSCTDYTIIAKGIHDSGFNIDEVVSGCSYGVDKLGEQWAHKNMTNIHRFPANWAAYGKGAGPIRNSQMAEYADALIAFPSKKSTGTRDMIKKAEKAGLKIFIVELE